MLGAHLQRVPLRVQFRALAVRSAREQRDAHCDDADRQEQDHIYPSGRRQTGPRRQR